MSSKWDRNPEKEGLKLSPKERDWKLAGMGGISGRRKPKKKKFFGDGSSSSDSTFDEADIFDSSTKEEDEDEDAAWNDIKPPALRLILEAAPLRKLAERHISCPSCGGDLEMHFKTMTITSSPSLQCKSKECSFIANARSPAEANLPQFEDDNRDRSTDFALNCQCVLSVTCNGDGPTEAGRMLGLLGLPNDTTMDSGSFGVRKDGSYYLGSASREYV